GVILDEQLVCHQTGRSRSRAAQQVSDERQRADSPGVFDVPRPAAARKRIDDGNGVHREVRSGTIAQSNLDGVLPSAVRLRRIFVSELAVFFVPEGRRNVATGKAERNPW